MELQFQKYVDSTPHFCIHILFVIYLIVEMQMDILLFYRSLCVCYHFFFAATFFSNVSLAGL